MLGIPNFGKGEASEEQRRQECPYPKLPDISYTVDRSPFSCGGLEAERDMG